MTNHEGRDTLVCTIHAPADEVYRHWTHPHLISRWMAPPRCAVREAEVDARVGGSYRIVAVGPAGDVHVTTGRSESTLTMEMHEPRPGVTQVTVRRGP